MKTIMRSNPHNQMTRSFVKKKFSDFVVEKVGVAFYSVSPCILAYTESFQPQHVPHVDSDSKRNEFQESSWG
jgi:hypothetical protein